MANRLETKKKRESRRRLHVRHRVAGTSERPRLTVAKSLKNVTAQLIDDSTGTTLAYWSSQSKGDAQAKVSKTDAAKAVGKKIAALALEKGIKAAVFDRNVNRYHGRIKAVADGAREAGLTI